MRNNFILGQKFGYFRENLKKSSEIPLSITVTDNLGNRFLGNEKFKSCEKGKINLSSEELNSMISKCRPGSDINYESITDNKSKKF